MNGKLSFKRVGNTASAFLVITFLVCLAFDLLMPGYAMYEAWAPLLPGFEGPGWPDIVFGLVGTYIYGWYIAVVWVPLYNHFGKGAADSGAG